jgi:uncharacterized membrane protein
MNWPDITCSLSPTWPDWLPDYAALPSLLAIAACMAALTLWTYLGARGTSAWRIAIVLLLRLGALAVALLVALRPSVGVQYLEGLEPSKVLILVDVSQSMKNSDGFNSQTRWDDARRILSARAVADTLKRLSADEQIEMVYYQGAEAVAPFEPQGQAEGTRTEIGTWLHELYQKHAGQDKLRGLLIFSDGADNGTRPTLDEARKWKGVCPIHTFGLGKPQQDSEQKDIVVASIQAAPSPVPAKTKLTVTGIVHALKFTDVVVDVELWMQGTKDKEPVLLGAKETLQLKEERNNKIVMVRDAPEEPDEYKLTLKIRKVEGEADETNNEASTYVQVTKEGITVLWVEGRKRYEATFAVRYGLGGDKRIRAFYTEVGPGSPVGPARFELNKRHYDVIVIGDLSARQFDGGDPKVLETIRDLVFDKKVGLMMLGGIDTFGKGGWGNTPLAKVLPVTFDTTEQVDSPVHVQPTKEGRRLYPFLRVDPDEQKNDKLWDSDFKALDGMARLGTRKEGHTLLATAKDKDVPILVAGRPGGRVLVFGGDTTERAWRRPETIDAYNRFWRQAILWLANQDDRTGNLWVELKSRRLLAGSPDRLDFKFGLKGKTDKPVTGGKFEVYAVGPGGAKINLQPELGKEEHRGVLPVPAIPGEYLLKVKGQGKDVDGDVADEKAVRFLVVAESLELQRKAPDHEHLREISRESGGEFNIADETLLLKLLGKLKGQVRRESHTKTARWPDWDRHPASDAWSDQLGGLWASAALIWFFAFAALLVAEWGLRRMWGMV